jgi:hypothetical protein
VCHEKAALSFKSSADILFAVDVLLAAVHDSALSGHAKNAIAPDVTATER